MKSFFKRFIDKYRNNFEDLQNNMNNLMNVGFQNILNDMQSLKTLDQNQRKAPVMKQQVKMGIYLKMMMLLESWILNYMFVSDHNLIPRKSYFYLYIHDASFANLKNKHFYLFLLLMFVIILPCLASILHKSSSYLLLG